MPQSPLYISDMGGFPRAGEPVLLNPTGKILVGTTEEEFRYHPLGTSAKGMVFRTDSVQGVDYMADNTNQGVAAYAGFSAYANGVYQGFLHVTGPAYNQGAIIYVANATYFGGTGAGGTFLGSEHSTAYVGIYTGGSGTGNERVRIISTGLVGIFGTQATFTPTAYVHIAAGGTAAGNTPIKLTSGSLNTTAVAGGIEFLTDKIYFTITTGAARKEIALADGALTSGRVPFLTTNGRLTDNAFWTYTAPNVLFSNTANSPTQVQCNAISGTAAYSMFQLQIAGSQSAFMSSTGASWTASGIYLASQANIGSSQSAGLNIVCEHASGVMRFVTGGVATTNERAQIDAAGNIVLSRVALATNATDGFVYYPSCPGAPSGTPTTKTGMIPTIVDDSNSKFMAYIGGTWKGVTLT